MGKENTEGNEDYPGCIRALTIAGFVAFDEDFVWGFHPTDAMEAFRDAKRWISQFARDEHHRLGAASPGWKVIRKRTIAGLRILPATPLGYCMAVAFSDEYQRFVVNQDMMFDAKEEDYLDDERMNREKIEIDGEPEPIIM